MGLGENHPSTILSKVKYDRLPCGLGVVLVSPRATNQDLGAKDHVLTLGISNNVASLYKGLGKFTEAEACYDETLALMEKTCGKTHMLTTGVRLNDLT